MTRSAHLSLALVLAAAATDVAGQSGCALCDTHVEIDRDQARCLAAAMDTHLAAAETGAARINLAECSGAIPQSPGSDADRGMPVVPGAQSVERMRTSPPGAAPPAIIILGREQLVCLERLLASFVASDEEVFVADLTKSCP